MGHFTACGAEVPHYTFKAKRIVLYNDNSIIATNLRFQVEEQVSSGFLRIIVLIRKRMDGSVWKRIVPREAFFKACINGLILHQFPVFCL